MSVNSIFLLFIPKNKKRFGKFRLPREENFCLILHTLTENRKNEVGVLSLNWKLFQKRTKYKKELQLRVVFKPIQIAMQLLQRHPAAANPVLPINSKVKNPGWVLWNPKVRLYHLCDTPLAYVEPYGQCRLGRLPACFLTVYVAHLFSNVFLLESFRKKWPEEKEQEQTNRSQLYYVSL